MIVGVDGCKEKWICVFKDLESGKLDAHRLGLQELIEWKPRPIAIAIDIPIGLSDSEPRKVDTAARKLLGQPRMSSVFSAPVRQCLKAAGYDEAKIISAEACGSKLSLQSYGILCKIREVDDKLQEVTTLREIVFEVHPEVSFWGWNGNRAIKFRKKSSNGKRERRSLIVRHFGQAIYDEIRGKYLKKEVPDDDLHDAFAALWTAERIAAGRAERVCQQDVYDSTGLPMQIWY